MRALRLFRGLSVPAAKRDDVIEKIAASGLVGNEGRWKIIHQHPGNIETLYEQEDLTTNITRPAGIAHPDVVCACGEIDGAAYYACNHNRSVEDDTPILVEFDAPLGDVAIDGRDFLYPVFQFGQPEMARDALSAIFGSHILRYAEKAWATDDQRKRIALCDLAIHDPAVVEAHHGNKIPIAGRYGTVFRSAFTVVCPIGPDRIHSVKPVAEPFNVPQAAFSHRDLIGR